MHPKETSLCRESSLSNDDDDREDEEEQQQQQQQAQQERQRRITTVFYLDRLSRARFWDKHLRLSDIQRRRSVCTSRTSGRRSHRGSREWHRCDGPESPLHICSSEEMRMEHFETGFTTLFVRRGFLNRTGKLDYDSRRLEVKVFSAFNR